MFLSLLICLSLCLTLLSFSLTFFFSSENPNSYPVIGSLISFYKNRRRLIHWYTHLLSESHSQTIIVSRLGAQRTIITANPDNVEYILKTKFSNFPKGKAFTEFLGDFLGFGIFNVDGEVWHSQRKLASHEFSARSLREFVVKVLEEEVENTLVPLLENACRDDVVLDFQQVLKSFAFDTICKVALGFDPSRLDSYEVARLDNAFDNASMISAMRAAAPVAAVWKLKRALNVGSEKKLKEAVAVVHDTVDEIIQLKKNKMGQNRGENGENNLLWRILSAGNDDEMVRDMVISFLMAGRDTTSSAMTWLFWLISKNEDVENELLNEVNSSSDELIFDKLKEMRYMKACICESMRLYPPVVWDSKHAVNDDVLPDGTVVYKGDRVTYFPYGMGRMEELWGGDRLEFRPDRWFDESGGLKMVSPYKFPVFQAGPRVCLGKEMAFIQMKYVVASVLKRFVIKPVSSDQPVFVPLLTGHMAGGLKVRVSKRV
ncbi:Cytochrome P450, E-class, group IV [Heracleum sosnowskyi]|uniref:Cytochrome P450, E-class, group IV n=1 Tax=Heracleum sosnowskyi TaxID=360622 RepID=A0AAD8M791_9APIA|nr:Cytochrome P450, E-class, group IV [Heracleum sosnowskyi]